MKKIFKSLIVFVTIACMQSTQAASDAQTQAARALLNRVPPQAQGAIIGGGIAFLASWFGETISKYKAPIVILGAAAGAYLIRHPGHFALLQSESSFDKELLASVASSVTALQGKGYAHADIARIFADRQLLSHTQDALKSGIESAISRLSIRSARSN